MTETVTRCPECSTAFKITPAQLETAKGAVRCGSCLQVFMAHDHMVADPQIVQAEPEASAAQDDFCIDEYKQDVFGEDAPLKDHEQADENGEERYTDHISERPDPNAGQTHDGADLQPAFESEDDVSVGQVDDEAWAQDILNELESDDKESLIKEATDHQAELDDMQLLAGSHEEEDHAEYPAEHNLEEHIGALDLSDEPDEIILDKDERATADFDEEELSTPTMPSSQDEDELINQDFESKEQLLDSIEPEPVELEYDEPGSGLRWLWALASVLALLGIIGQFAYLKFEPYNRIEPYRQWYAQACGLIGCQLPPQQDLNQIKTYNLIVRSHGETAQALSIDMVILNTAIYEQTFPGIRLSFSDKDNEVIASRDFTAKDYLAGELAGRKNMPIQQPIHLSFSILDPGEAAVNYQVEAIPSKL